ncbi:MAG: tetratricopeptide repeat protein [Candidatus Binataceae bacterium]
MASASGETGGRPVRPPWFPNRGGAGIMAILAVTALAYARSLGNGFVFDDHYWTNYPLVRQWPFIWKSFAHDVWWFMDPNHLPYSQFYRPLQDTWMALNLHLFGRDPIGWHAATIALHLIAVWLLYRVAELLSGDELTTLLAAALFALMPVHAEAIAWPSGVPEPLGAVFELAAFALYLRSGAHRTRRIALSMGWLAGALLSHDSAVVFPLLVAAHAFLLAENRSDTAYRTYAAGARDAVVATLPYAIEAAVYLGVRSWVLHSTGSPIPRSYLPIFSVMALAPFTVADYAKLLAIPWLAGPAHPQIGPGSIASPEFYLPLIGLIAIAATAIAALRKNPRRRLYLFCAALMLVPLIPILYVAPFDIQDRYLYLPSAGFCLMAADLAVSYGRADRAIAWAIRSGAIAMLLLYAAVLIPVQHFWHDDVTLDRRCIENSPKRPFCHNLLATVLEERGELEPARNELNTAIDLDPKAGGEVYFQLGRIDRRLNDRTAAARAMAEGLRRIARPPPAAFIEYAVAAASAGDKVGAENALRQVLQTDPGNRQALALLHALERGAPVR